jgi:hypothetical protein
MERDFHRGMIDTLPSLNNLQAACKPRRLSGFSSGLWTRSLIRKSNQPLRVSFVFDQGEVALRKATRKQRDAFTEQNGNDTQMEPINQIHIQEGPSRLPATHQPDVFARASADFANESGRCFIDEDDAVSLTGSF